MKYKPPASRPDLLSRSQRRRLSDLLIFTGGFLLFFVILLGLKVVLASQQSVDGAFLRSTAQVEFPFPTSPAEPEPDEEIRNLYLPLISKIEPVAGIDGVPEPGAAPVVTRKPSAGPVIRLVIPQIQVDRAVVPLGLRKGAGNQMEWNTDALFANGNRSDLVGQMVTSVNPGDGGNIVLVGHNYNEGWYAWAGVFVNLLKLSPGSKIILYTEDGSEFQYIVQVVKKVPWSKQNSAELEKHQKFLWPTENEQVTLVTCGGEMLLSWSARIYVVATPAGDNSG